MHEIDIPEALIHAVVARRGKAHAFDRLDPTRTALVVIDMQNYFVAPGHMGEVPMAREIVPNINRLAAEMRRRGGTVGWVQNSTDDTRESWSVLHDWLLTPESRDRRMETMAGGSEGFALWPELDARREDLRIVKKRFSAFIEGSSDIAARLRARGIDTILVAGTATNICCESSARDAMMLNFKVVMLTDATATFTDAQHNASLQVFYSLFGDILSVDETVAALEAGRVAPAA